MTVRGGKNRLLTVGGGILLVIALVLFYHNAATRLEEARRSYDKCHLNEESLSAQLQVILEYKVRLEKSLQQGKSELAETKEDLKNKVDEERRTRERENLESINKFTALQQQYKLLQSQHEDVTGELEKAKQQLLSLEDEKSLLRKQINSLTKENKHLQEVKDSDTNLLREKLTKVEADFEKLRKGSKNENWEQEKDDLRRELTECLRKQSSSTPKRSAEGGAEDALRAPLLSKRSSSLRSSTAASHIEIVSGQVLQFNTSTPHINPDALQSQDRNFNNVVPPPIPALGKVPLAGEEQQPLAEPETRLRPELPRPPRPAALNEIQRINSYNYQAEYDKEGRKEEDDDDFDQLDFPNANEKHPDGVIQPANVVIADKHDSVQVHPK